jgi:hypothetical protein
MNASRFGGRRVKFQACAILIALAALLPAVAKSDPPHFRHSFQLWLSPGLYSYHFDRSKDLRDENFGFGIEVTGAGRHGLMAGIFRNSNDRHSRYAGYQWRPLKWTIHGVDLHGGIALVAMDGYPNYRNGGWFLAPLPVLAVEGRYLGANIAVIPSLGNRVDGALALQMKLRVW